MRHNIQKWSEYAKISSSLYSKENRLEKNTNASCDSCDEYQLCVEEETPFVAMSNVHPLPCHLVTLKIVEGVLCQCVADEMRDKYSHLICRYVDKIGELNL